MKPLSEAKTSNFHPLLGVRELVAFDLETTGLRHKEEEITQIAGVRLSGISMDIDDSFSSYVNPGKPIPAAIQKLTRVRDAHVKDAPTPLEALQAFSEWADKATLFGHDIYRFDFNFIRKHARLDGVKTRTVRFIDTMDIFEAMWPGFSRLSNSLDDIAERLSAGLSSMRRHDAMSDAILLTHIFQRIQDNPQLERISHYVPVHEAEIPAHLAERERSYFKPASNRRKYLTYSF